ncbi:MAG: pyrroline-5-carboxylate reductase [Thioalkalivibrionaceae bacterium]
MIHHSNPTATAPERTSTNAEESARFPLDAVFVGAGRMGQALLKGLLARLGAHRIGFVETHEPTAASLLESHPELTRLSLSPAHPELRSAARSPSSNDAATPSAVHGASDRTTEHREAAAPIEPLSHAVRDTTIVILAVKPQSFDTLASELSPLQLAPAAAVSVMAGVPAERLAGAFAPGTPIARAMPNTPALAGVGMTGLWFDAHFDVPRKARIETLLLAVGQALEVTDEAQLHAVTALSGSGPAYLFRFGEALIRAGTTLGLDEAQASLLARETLFGAATLARGEPDLAGLRAQVTSPGGTTAAALECFDRDGRLDALVKEALAAAHQRSRALAHP